jgi:RNA methyltransferase, TrmH family
MSETITSSSNPLLKQIRSLRQRKGRDETGLFLVEGIHHVGEAIEAGWEIEALVYAPDQLTSDFARRLVEKQSLRGMRCAAITPTLFTAIAEKDNPQGILAVVRQQYPGLQETSLKAFRTAAALVSPQDPGNVGAILRTLDATGADGLFLLDGGVDPYHPSCIRASMGTIFWKPIIQTSFDEFVKWARKNGFQLIGSSAHATTDAHAYQREAKPVILLLGSEQKGLSKEQLTACDASLSLPMKGRVSSLNLAVAAGILLYTIME